MRRQVRVDPFRYSRWDVTTLALRGLSVVAGVVLMIQGEPAGLLGLVGLAGGAKGNLISEAGAALRSSRRRGGPWAFISMALVLVWALAGCGTGLSRQFLVDSQAAALAAGQPYLADCRQVTIAPAFSVDWNRNVSFGGGLFAGCAELGRLLELRCRGEKDDETGRVEILCEPLSLWHQEELP